MVKFKNILLALIITFICVDIYAANYTVMVDSGARVVYPANNLRLTGTTWADILKPTYLFVNGVQLIPTTNGFSWVAGMNSNQVGSKTGALTVTNDPISGDSLKYDGVYAYWTSNNNSSFLTQAVLAVSYTNSTNNNAFITGSNLFISFNTNYSTTNGGSSFPSNGDWTVNSLTANIIQVTAGNFDYMMATGGSFDQISLDGSNITSWSQISGSVSGDLNVNSLTANVVQATAGNFDYMMATGGSFDQISLDGSNITEWSQISSGSGISSNWSTNPAVSDVNMSGYDITNAGDIIGNSFTGNVVQATAGNFAYTMATGASFNQVTLNGSAITNWGQLTNGISTTGGGSNWSSYPATQNVNMSGHSFTNMGDITANSFTGNVVQADVGNFASLMATQASFDSMIMSGITITNFLDLTNTTLGTRYEVFNVRNPTNNTAVQIDTRGDVSQIQMRDLAGNVGCIQFRTNQFWYTSGASSDITQVSGLLATGVPIYVETDPYFTVWKNTIYNSNISGDIAVSSLTTPLINATVINASNIVAPAASFDQITMGGSNITSWSQVGGNIGTNPTFNSVTAKTGTFDKVLSSRFGYLSKTVYTNALAIGYFAQSENYNSIAIGENSYARMKEAPEEVNMAIGANSYAFGNDALALGEGAWAIGNRFYIEPDSVSVVAIGKNVTNGIANSVALRGNLYLDGGSNIYYRSSFGSGAWTLFSNSDYITNWSKSPAISTVNMGTYGISNAGDITANSFSGNVMQATVGNFSNATIVSGGFNQISLGSSNITSWSQISGSIGTNATFDSITAKTGSFDRVLTLQIGAGATANPDTYSGSSSMAMGINSMTTGSVGGIAIGNGARVRDGDVNDWTSYVDCPIAIGENSFCESAYGVAIGKGASVHLSGITAANSYGAVALGYNVNNNNNNTIAVRGNVYIDGGNTIYYRSSFGSGGWTVYSQAATWANNPASTNINANSYTITNAIEIKASKFTGGDGYFNGVTSVVNQCSQVLNTTNILCSGVGSFDTLNLGGINISSWASLTNGTTVTNVSTWSSFPALTTVNANSQLVTNATTIAFVGGGSLTFNSTSNAFYFKGNP